MVSVQYKCCFNPCLNLFSNLVHIFISSTLPLGLGSSLSGVVWALIMASGALVMWVPRKSGMITLVGSVTFKLIYFMGPESTLTMLGMLTVSILTLKMIVTSHVI